MYSRQSIKKYVKSNNKITTTSETQFDSLFNKALKSGVEKGDFLQPKGPSGPVKLAKKEAKPAEKKPAAPKVRRAYAMLLFNPTNSPQKEKTETKPKATKAKATTKKAAAPKTTKAKTATKPKTAAKPKANTATKRAPKAKAPKTEKPAPAVQDVPTVLKKTSSGRVSKQKTTTGATKAKPAAKKAAPKKKATPKKAAA